MNDNDFIKEIVEKQIILTKELTALLASMNNTKKDYIKSLKHIAMTTIIGIITAFIILTSIFYISYFWADYSDEIKAKNTTEHTETYNYNEYKETKGAE